MVKVWDVGGVGPGSLRLTWGYGGIGVDPASTSEETDVLGATAVEAIKTNLKSVAVAYRNATVKIFEVDSGKEAALLQADGVGEYYPSLFNGLFCLVHFHRWYSQCAGQCYGISPCRSDPCCWL
jgi:hypothetical protein